MLRGYRSRIQREVKIAHAPLVALLTELMEAAGEAGELRPGINPQRIAAMTMRTVMLIAQSSGGPDEGDRASQTADEVWDFCSRGFVGNELAKIRAYRSARI